MNFSSISSETPLGRVLRFPLRWIPPGTTIRILQGRLRGKKWIVGSGEHGYWLGSYEWKKQHTFEKLVLPGSVVFDIGAHVGFYTLLASVLVGPQGRVFAFEPVPLNVVRLRSHLALNDMRNVTVVEAAVSDRGGLAQFGLCPSDSMGHLSTPGRSTQGSIQVKTVSLDELISTSAVPVPNHIKIDVEGAELLVLLGARRLLEEFHPTLYLATDVGDLHDECCQVLNSLGYDLDPIDGSTLKQSYEILACHKRGKPL